jgi:predicted enzyme related to lactoylglutathione lyase
MTSYEHGVPSWIDIGVSDFDASAAFYHDLFGWEIPEGDEATGFYRSVTLDGRIVAGMSPMQMTPGPPFWTTYVNVDRTDDVVAKVAGTGGQVLMPPMDVMDFGRMAILADPTGAAIGLWQPRSHGGAEVTNEPGSYCWSELLTDDLDAAKAFYAAVLGWEARSGEGDMPYTEFQVGGRSVAGMMARPPMMPAEVPNHWGVYFAVDDLAASLAKATELGATAMVGTIDTPAGQVAPITDPTGASLDHIQLGPRHRG